MSTLFLATVMGWYLVITSVFLLVRHNDVKALGTDVLKQRGLCFLLAIMTLIFGLLLVVSHNIWVKDWPVVITILSWLVLCSGLLRLFFLDVAVNMGKSYLSHPYGIRIPAIVFLLLGLYLLSHVYYPHL